MDTHTHTHTHYTHTRTRTHAHTRTHARAHARRQRVSHATHMGRATRARARACARAACEPHSQAHAQRWHRCACYWTLAPSSTLRPDAGAPRCFLCSRCAKRPQVVQRLQQHNLTLDVTGLSGKPLYTGKESKFAAEVSKLSKEAQDNASGARADVLRHAGKGRRR